MATGSKNTAQENSAIIDNLQQAYNSLFNNMLISINMLAQEEEEENVYSLLLSFTRLIIYYESAVIYLEEENQYKLACAMNLSDEYNGYFNIDNNKDLYEWAKLQLRVSIIPEDDQFCHVIAPILSNQNYIGVLHLFAKVDSSQIIKQNIDMLWLLVNSVAAKINQIRLGQHSKLIETILNNLKKINTSKSLNELIENSLQGIKNLINADSLILIKNNDEVIIKSNNKKLLKSCFAKKFQKNASCPIIDGLTDSLHPVFIARQDKENYCNKRCTYLKNFLETEDMLIAPLVQNKEFYGFFALSSLSYNSKLVNPETKHIIALFAEQVTISIRQLKLLEDLGVEKEKALTYSKAKSDFLANISHEIRTPLSIVIGNAEILQLGLYGELTEKQKQSIDQMKVGAEHLLSIINDILDISKIETGEISLHPQPSNHKKIINEIVQLVKPLSDKKNIEINVDLQDETEFITLDQVRFKQILFNLISNSIKYTLDNGKVLVKTESNGDNNFIILSVQDSGVGISQKDYEKVFAPFQQIHNFRIKNQQGTGLGLAITKRLVELHKGTIGFESTVGVGTTFTVELPV